MKYIFFGTSEFSVSVLDQLKKINSSPMSCVTFTDKKIGRGLKLTPNPVKVWCQKNNIPFFEITNFKNPEFNLELISKLKAQSPEIFLVASFGKIIPDDFIYLPPHKTLNIHPSLLPKFRGASPVESAILADQKNTGMTLMLINDKMDAGEILAQEEINFVEWPSDKKEIYEKMAESGAKLFNEFAPQYLAGNLKLVKQEETEATFTKKMSKDDGLIDLNGDPRQNFLKFLAYNPWPSTYFFAFKQGDPSKKIRFKITKAKFEDGQFKILKVIPEGKKETDFKNLIF